MITDGDGHPLPHAWANAWDGDSEMEGLRVRVEEVEGRLTAVGIHPEDADGAVRWDRDRISEMMDGLTASLRRGDATMANDEGDEAWQTR